MSVPWQAHGVNGVDAAVLPCTRNSPLLLLLPLHRPKRQDRVGGAVRGWLYLWVTGGVPQRGVLLLHQALQ